MVKDHHQNSFDIKKDTHIYIKREISPFLITMNSTQYNLNLSLKNIYSHFSRIYQALSIISFLHASSISSISTSFSGKRTYLITEPLTKRLFNESN